MVLVSQASITTLLTWPSPGIRPSVIWYGGRAVVLRFRRPVLLF